MTAEVLLQGILSGLLMGLVYALIPLADLRSDGDCQLRPRRVPDGRHVHELLGVGPLASRSAPVSAAHRLPALRARGRDLLGPHPLDPRRADNFLLGAYPPGARARRATTRAEVEALFPLLQARWGQPAHTLPGGEQQMVVIARGLMASPLF
jgi:hypothetical protein